MHSSNRNVYSWMLAARCCKQMKSNKNNNNNKSGRIRKQKRGEEKQRQQHADGTYEQWKRVACYFEAVGSRLLFESQPLKVYVLESGAHILFILSLFASPFRRRYRRQIELNPLLYSNRVYYTGYATHKRARQTQSHQQLSLLTTTISSFHSRTSTLARR